MRDRSPLCIDLFAGRGGWTRGFLAEGYDCIGFDIERHACYPGQLVLQDVMTLHGSQFRGATVIVASPPCQAYSYRAMPWKRAKALPPPDNTLFEACFRIAKEAGVPIVVENVKGAQPWVGRAKAHYGSYYLWGDVESVGGAIVASRPQFGQVLRARRAQKFNPDGTSHGQGSWFAVANSKNRGGQKREGGNFHAFENGLGNSPSFNGGDHETRGVKVTAAEQLEVLVSLRDESGVTKGTGGGWFEKPYRERGDITGQFNSKSSARKEASAIIAEIPFDLAQWIARCFAPASSVVAKARGEKGGL